MMLFFIEGHIDGRRVHHFVETSASDANEMAAGIVRNFEVLMRAHFSGSDGRLVAEVPYGGAHNWREWWGQLQRAFIASSNPKCLNDYDVPEGCEPDALGEYLTDEGLDTVSGYSISCTPLEAKGTIPVPGRLPEKIRLYTMSSDDKDGTNASIYASEELAYDALLAKIGKGRSTFNQWALEQPKQRIGKNGPDIWEFIQAHTEPMDTYNVLPCEVDLRDALGDHFPSRCEIDIILDGGLVQDVHSRNGFPTHARVLDFDTEGADEDHIDEVDSYYGGEAVVSEFDIGGKARPTLDIVTGVLELRDGGVRVTTFRTEAELAKDFAEFYEAEREKDGEYPDPPLDGSEDAAEIGRLLRNYSLVDAYHIDNGVLRYA